MLDVLNSPFQVRETKIAVQECYVMELNSFDLVMSVTLVYVSGLSSQRELQLKV